MSFARRFVVKPCDNGGTLTDGDGNPPPRDRTWDVVDTTCDAVVFANCYTRREAREEADKLNATDDQQRVERARTRK